MEEKLKKFMLDDPGVGHGDSFIKGYHAAMAEKDEKVQGLVDALEKARTKIVCMDAGQHYKNRKCGYCDAASAVEEALEKGKEKADKAASGETAQ